MEKFKNQVDEFVSSENSQIELQCESLTSSERYYLHNYCRSLNLCSESKALETRYNLGKR